jgi:hypothetical protein
MTLSFRVFFVHILIINEHFSHQAQTGTPAPDPTLAFRFEDLTMEIQWKGAVAIGVAAFIAFLVVCIRDVFGLCDFGKYLRP